MHVETNPVLLADSLWSALEDCRTRLAESPQRVLREKVPNYTEGLNAAKINELVGRTVFAVVEHPDRTELQVHHPDIDQPVTWIISQLGEWLTPIEQSDPKLKRTIAYVLAWQTQCARELLSGDTALKSKTDVAATLMPKWDPIKRELWLGAHLLKTFDKHPASAQTDIIDRFEAAHWHPGVESDSATHPDRDKKAYQRLNKTLATEARQKKLQQVIQFRGDGTGDLILWELIDTPT